MYKAMQKVATFIWYTFYQGASCRGNFIRQYIRNKSKVSIVYVLSLPSPWSVVSSSSLSSSPQHKRVILILHFIQRTENQHIILHILHAVMF